MITKHPIYQDFPEYADKIKDLYHNNDEFQVLLHSYTDLDEKIYKIFPKDIKSDMIDIDINCIFPKEKYIKM